ncbi:hypothetical protein O6H91_Y121100 [Diphasiastrum complanatum]|nr:hypothetical protein O6H91_Y121100 [Diphasiastrum complanatum]KAJ7299900.1 hypothetical protein O6H91_Y121100 [Diphasiastrum complanatum]
MEVEKSIEDLLPGDIERAGLSPIDAANFYRQLGGIISEVGDSRPATWRRISKEMLLPVHPHSLHQLMYYSTYKHWDDSKYGPPPACFPTEESARESNLGRILEKYGPQLLGSSYRNPIESFPAFQKFSAEHPEVYWPIVFEDLNLFFHVQPNCILDKSDKSHPCGVWLPGAVLNVSECCLLPTKNKNDTVAVIWRDEDNDNLPPATLTLAELRLKVNRVANALDGLGLQRGDAIAIDMPMDVFAVIIYLAIILAGYVVVSIADSFVSNEIATRIRISKAKCIFTQDNIVRGGKVIPLYSRVVDANAPQIVVLPSNGKHIVVDLRNGDMAWESFLSLADKLSIPDEYVAVKQAIEAHTNILFSSGTTGEPKAIPWTQATPIRCAGDAWAHYDIRPGDVFAWPTNLGWMMGPLLIFASLLNGATIALYKGLPLGRSFGKFVQDAGVTVLGTVPSMVKTWKKSSCMDFLDWSRIRHFGTTGEASSLDDDLWLSGQAGYKPVYESCGGTELGSAFVQGCPLQPQAYATFSTPCMTTSFVILDESRRAYPDDQPCHGELALLPAMLGASNNLLNADHDAVYFKGMPAHNGVILRRHGDLFERTVGGFYKAQGRSDDTMNLGGIKISAVEIERVCNTAHHSVLETAAIGVPPDDGGPEHLVMVVVLKDEQLVDTAVLKKSFSSAIHSRLNPLFKVSSVVIVPDFPRTASNKVMRRVLRSNLRKLGNSPKCRL